MARDTAVIQQGIIDTLATDGITISSSSTSRRRLWTRAMAVCGNDLERIFDTHKTEVDDIISLMKPGSLKWYAQIARDFQYGYDLVPDEDYYDNTDLTDEQIADSKVVAYAAVIEQERALRIKVARVVGGDLSPLSAEQLTAFVEYMARVKYAGTKLIIDSLPPDGLKLQLRIYYNPLVLNSNGDRLDGAVLDPVGKTVRAYLQNLPFNGTFVLAYLIDELQRVDGVIIPHLVGASAQYGIFPYTAFDVKYIPDSGYLRLLVNEDIQVEYIPQSVIL